MASIGSTRGTDLPRIDESLRVANDSKTVKNTLLNRGFKLTPDSYTTVDDLIKATREDVMPDLVKIYGDQGLTGFLKLTGAVNSGGSSDQIDWWEEGRRHRAYTISDDLSGPAGASLSISDADFQTERSEERRDHGCRDWRSLHRSVWWNQAGTASAVVLVKMDGTASPLAT